MSILIQEAELIPTAARHVMDRFKSTQRDLAQAALAGDITSPIVNELKQLEEVISFLSSTYE